MFHRAITYGVPVTIFVIVLPFISEAYALPPQEDGLSHTSATHLILKNGQVIQGQISRDANSVYVQTAGGSRVVFPVEKVEFVCSSMNEAYWQKNARVKASDVAGHVGLFHWCMKQGLLKEAENQIDLLVAMDIKASHLEYLNRQLTVALGQHKRWQLRQLAQQRSLEPTLPAKASETTGDGVKLVGYEVNTETSLEIQRLSDLKQIEAAAESLPKTSVGIFKRKIEPMLVRNCYRCHANEATDVMPLMRLGKNQVIPKRFSQRNLFSVLKYTDLNAPLASRIFAAAVSPHADLAKPILKKDSVQYINLGNWLIQISARPNELHVAPNFEHMAELPGQDSTVSPSTKPLPAASPISPISSVNMGRSEHVPDIPQLHESRSNKKSMLDPFDADVFNRKHLGAKKEQD